MMHGNTAIEWMNQVLRQEAEKGCLTAKGVSIHTDRWQPAIFIVGLPRSGTTLLHQVLAKRLRIGYVDNVIARFWGYPPAGIELSRQLILESARESMPMSSDLGRTPGPEGPHEFGYFWNHWFNFDGSGAHHASEKVRSRININGLRDALLEMQRTFDCPLLFKNLQCGFQADIVQEAYPNSIFIRVERDLSEIGRSILAARKWYYGSYESWLSIKPRGWPVDVPGNGPGAEVAWQVFEGHNQIKDRLNQVKNLLTLHYGEILAQPEAVIKRVVNAISDAGGVINLRGERIPVLSKRKPADIPPQLMTQFDSQLRIYQAGFTCWI